MRRAAKVDANQPEIVKALRECGATVLHLHTIGQGAPDIAVGFCGKNLLLEIKDGKKKLTKDEQEFFDTWRGQVAKVESVDDALLLLLGK